MSSGSFTWTFKSITLTRDARMRREAGLVLKDKIAQHDNIVLFANFVWTSPVTS